MSGFCLVVEPAGASLRPAVLERMAAACVERDPERVERRVAGGFGAAWLSVETAPGAEPEALPVVSRDGRLTLVADVRLDNRAELSAELDVGPVAGGGQVPDAELLLLAFQRWGRSCPRRLVGDYVFAVWDAVEEKLFVARDALGVRSVYYARSGGRLLVATGVGAVVAGLESEPALNRPLAQDFLANRLDRWVSETVYSGVHRLPQAYTLTAGREGVSLERYWVLGETAVRYRRRGEYVEHFRELLREALTCRLRTVGPPALFVSGGVDSSSLACLAASLHHAGELDSQLRLYSMVFERTPHADEREYLEAVAERCGAFPIARIPADDAWGLKEFGGDNGYPLDEPELSIGRAFWLRAIARAQQDGCRVGLWGNGGDQAMGGDAYHFPTNLLDVGWLRLPREARHFRRPKGPPLAWRLARAGLRRLCPQPALAAGQRFRDRLRPPSPLERLSPPSRAPFESPLTAPGLGSRSARQCYRLLTCGGYSAMLAEVDHQGRHSGFEMRYPYLDRRLVDFLLGVPPELRFAEGLEKTLVRSALVRELPAEVRERSTYAHFSGLLTRGLSEEAKRVEELLTDARIVQEGLVEGARLQEAWSCYVGEKKASYSVHGLVRALCLEAWLRYHGGIRGGGKVWGASRGFDLD